MAAQTLVQVQLVLRLALGLVFLCSAVAKLRTPAAFVQGVLDYAVLPRLLGQMYGRLLPFIELGTALLLLSGFLSPVAASFAVLMLVSFAIAMSVVMLQGRQIGCHCLGAASSELVGWPTMLRDLILLALAVTTAWFTFRIGSMTALWPAAQDTLAAVCSSVTIVAIYLLIEQWLSTMHLGKVARQAHKSSPNLRRVEE